ncbi:hypothetical protein NPIL_67541 [Nephila pilipes]|uniref:Uncharacterized protein n=1 Tax=Nephila pilipes TaxID=299642 RepID=A0A8X6NJQ7_NEPPI|nr:hypothetical protein NPIL_67541 [Nephila pilipes]
MLCSEYEVKPEKFAGSELLSNNGHRPNEHPATGISMSALSLLPASDSLGASIRLDQKQWRPACFNDQMKKSGKERIYPVSARGMFVAGAIGKKTHTIRLSQSV